MGDGCRFQAEVYTGPFCGASDLVVGNVAEAPPQGSSLWPRAHGTHALAAELKRQMEFFKVCTVLG